MTTLDAPTSSGPPAIKFTEPGSNVVVGIVDVYEFQQRDDDGNKLTWDDGSPKMGKAVVGLVVNQSGAYTGKKNEPPKPVAPGDLVTFYCQSGKYFTWRDAVQAYGAVSVGDVMKWERLEDKPPRKSTWSPQQVYKAQIRKPDTHDGDIVDRCIAARQERTERPQVDQPAQTTEAAPFDDERW